MLLQRRYLAVQLINLRHRLFTKQLFNLTWLDSGDRVRVTVFEQTDLTGTYGVDQPGYLSFPLVGAVAARGRTAQELEGVIATALKQGYLRDPDVSIEIDQYRSFFVLGEIGQPGQYAYVPGMTVQNAIAIAGGFFNPRPAKNNRHHPQD